MAVASYIKHEIDRYPRFNVATAIQEDTTTQLTPQPSVQRRQRAIHDRDLEEISADCQETLLRQRRQGYQYYHYDNSHNQDYKVHNYDYHTDTNDDKKEQPWQLLQLWRRYTQQLNKNI